MQAQGHMNHKMSHELPAEMHVQLCSETGSVCHFFWWEFLTLKSCTLLAISNLLGAVLCLPRLCLPQGLEPIAKPPAKPAPKAAKPRAKPSTKSAAKPAAQVAAKCAAGEPIHSWVRVNMINIHG